MFSIENSLNWISHQGMFWRPWVG